MKQFGFAPAGAVAQNTYDVYYSTRAFDVGVSIPTRIDFFNPATQAAPSQYSNFQLPSPNTLPINVLGFRVELSIVFDITASVAATAPNFQQYFEENSLVMWERERKGVTGVRVTEAVSYTWQSDGTTTGLVQNQKRNFFYYKFAKADQVEIPPGGRTSFWIQAPQGLLTATPGTVANPILQDLGFTNELGNYIRLVLFTEVQQRLV